MENDARRSGRMPLARGIVAAACALTLCAGELWTGPLSVPGRSAYEASRPAPERLTMPPLSAREALEDQPEDALLRALLEGPPELSRAVVELLSGSEGSSSAEAVEGEPGASTQGAAAGAAAAPPASRSATSSSRLAPQAPVSVRGEQNASDFSLDLPRADGGPGPSRSSPPQRSGAGAGGAQASPQTQAAAPKRPQGWRWPAKGPVTSRFGMRWGRHHDGVDIGARYGSAITAAKDGRVIWSGPFYGYGRTVILDHGRGVKTLYAHASTLLVRRGARVRQGQRLARVGCTGHCFGPHLHFEIRLKGRPVNPLKRLPRR